ncbi:hypothetical protein Hanom_Chr16g01475971 [Helianthus anomalus]
MSLMTWLDTLRMHMTKTIEKLWPNNPMLACDSSCQRIRINIGEYLEADRDELYHLDYCGRSFFYYFFLEIICLLVVWLL